MSRTTTFLVAIMMIIGFTTEANAAEWSNIRTGITPITTSSVSTDSISSYPETCTILLILKEDGTAIPIEITPGEPFVSFGEPVKKIILVTKECDCAGTAFSEMTYEGKFAQVFLDNNHCTAVPPFSLQSIMLACSLDDLIKKS
jgi:hypothetical protein